MGDKRIIHVKNIAEASSLINRDFAEHFPIPLRGILASLNGIVDLSYHSKGKLIELKIKGIEQILKDGTELDLGSGPGWTRVDYYSNHRNWAFVYAKDRSRIDYWAKQAGISDEKKRLLNPAILVYDKSFLTQLKSVNNIFNVRIPERSKDRGKAIMAIYVNHTEDTDDWSQTPF